MTALTPTALLILDDIAVARDIRDSVSDIGWKVMPLINMVELGAIPQMNDYNLVVVSADMASDTSLHVFPVLKRAKCRLPILLMADTEEHRVNVASEDATKAGFKISGRLPTTAGYERIKAAFKANTPK